MHLAGEANARDLIAANASVRERFANGDLRRSPPVVGILLRIAGLLRCDRACSSVAAATIFPLASRISARDPLVPTSIPSKFMTGQRRPVLRE